MSANIHHPYLKISHLKVAKEYDFRDSDLTLISADGVHFKIHSYAIIGSSRVLRDMISVCDSSKTPKIIQLVDEDIEDMTSIRLYLDIVYGRSLRQPSTSAHYDRYDRLIQFLLKYEVAYPLEHLKTCFRLWIQYDRAYLDRFFLFGCILDDVYLAASAIHYSTSVKGRYDELELPKLHGPSHHTKQIQSSPSRVSERRTGYHDRVDISSWSLSQFQRIPDEYKLSLLRAEKDTSKDENGANDWHAMAYSFLGLVIELRRNR